MSPFLCSCSVQRRNMNYCDFSNNLMVGYTSIDLWRPTTIEQDCKDCKIQTSLNSPTTKSMYNVLCARKKKQILMKFLTENVIKSRKTNKGKKVISGFSGNHIFILYMNHGLKKTSVSRNKISTKCTHQKRKICNRSTHCNTLYVSVTFCIYDMKVFFFLWYYLIIKAKNNNFKGLKSYYDIDPILISNLRENELSDGDYSTCGCVEVNFCSNSHDNDEAMNS